MQLIYSIPMPYFCGLNKYTRFDNLFIKKLEKSFLSFFQSVVSAISDPDTIVIKNRFWESENSLSIESSKIGAKKTRIDMSTSSSGFNILHHAQYTARRTIVARGNLLFGPQRPKFLPLSLFAWKNTIECVKTYRFWPWICPDFFWPAWDLGCAPLPYTVEQVV